MVAVLRGMRAAVLTSARAERDRHPHRRRDLPGRGRTASVTPTTRRPATAGTTSRNYDLELRYDPATDRLTGTAAITATATADLSRFNLDFTG